MNGNYIDTMLSNTVTWINKMIDFILQFKFIFAIGFLAMMVSKFAKVNLKMK